MEFEQFVEEIKSRLEESFGCDVSLSVSKVLKNNSTKITGICVKSVKSSIAPIYYLDEDYSMFEKGKRTVEDIVHKIYDSYKYMHPPVRNMDYFLDYSRVKDRIVYKLINTEMNKELLEDVPHIEFLDLSIVFTYLLESGDEYGLASVLIHNSHMEYWQVSVQELYNLAKANTSKLLEYEFKSLDKVLMELGGLQQSSKDVSNMLFILTNKKRTNGAACVLYTDVIKNIVQKFDSGFYIIPSSIHEVLLYPSDESSSKEADSLRDMVKEVNDTQLEPEEILSYSVYFVNKFDCEITRVA